jgi:hypothetical protein
MFENFLNNKRNNNKDEIQKSGKRYGRQVDKQGRYVENLEHIRGNAAIGEQVHSARTFKTDEPMTFEEMKVHWDEMNREAKEWLDNNPGQSANFLTSQGVDGNEITRVIPTKDLIFSGSDLVAVYDENGNQIVGKENIIREVQRRRAESDKWVREGKMENIFDEIHHTDDGWTSNVRFTAYPNQLHPNEVRAENERLLRIAEGRSENDKRKNRFLGDGVDSDTEETSKSLIDASNKKSRTGEKEIPTLVGMDIDQPETSTSKGQENSPAETSQTQDNSQSSELDNVSNLTREERISEINQLRARITELESRENLTSSEKQEKQNKLEKLEKLESYSVDSKPTNPDNKSPTGLIVGAFLAVSALAIGGIAFVKSKLGKSKRK